MNQQGKEDADFYKSENQNLKKEELKLEKEQKAQMKKLSEMKKKSTKLFNEKWPKLKVLKKQ